MIGQTLSHYRITEFLGGGGMGMVYKAEDVRLGRPVALKILPPELIRNGEAQERFEQEARAASALDHPNICTIHDIDRTEPLAELPEGRLFIVMAYYDGETLKKKLERGCLPIDLALEYAAQIARALQAAHEAGIVHRDVKPANVIVTQKGVAKLLDFGIAKLTSGPDLTRVGSTVGTVSYMSPEQSRGESVDHLSDIWSLGVVLYEMLVGRRPFLGDYESAVKYAIQQEDPVPVSHLRPEIPDDVERLVACLLSKTPALRSAGLHALLLYGTQVAADGSHTLSTGSGPAIAFRGSDERPRRWRRRTVFAVVGSLLALSALLVVRRWGGPRDYVEVANARQLTTSGSNVDAPSWSPAGDRIVFGSDRDGEWDVWEIQVSDRSTRNITEEGSAQEIMPSWSPDGNQIAFTIPGANAGLQIMPALGGAMRRVAELHPDYFFSASWSVDGRSLAFAKTPMAEIISLTDNSSRTVPLAGQLNQQELTWSNSGRFLAYVEAADRGSPTSVLWRTRLDDESSLRLTNGDTWDFNPVFAPDDRSLFFVSDRGGGKDIWQLRLDREGKPKEDPRRVTNGLDARYLALSRDGSRMAVTIDRSDATVWRIPLLSHRTATWEDGSILAEGLKPIRQPDLSPDQRSLVVDAEQMGSRDLWLLSLEDGQLRPAATLPTRGVNPDWSPDGNRIAYHTAEGNSRAIWILDLATGRKTRVIGGAPYAGHEHMALVPRWSPDGTEIAFHSGGDPVTYGADVWVVSAEGGEPRRLTSDSADDRLPQWSPDGRMILFRSDRSGKPTSWIVPRSGGDAIPVPEIEGSATWTTDGSGLVFTRGTDLGVEFFLRDMATGAVRQLTSLRSSVKTGRLSGYVVATGALILIWQHDLADIWIMDLVN